MAAVLWLPGRVAVLVADGSAVETTGAMTAEQAGVRFTGGAEARRTSVTGTAAATGDCTMVARWSLWLWAVLPGTTASSVDAWPGSRCPAGAPSVRPVDGGGSSTAARSSGPGPVSLRGLRTPRSLIPVGPSVGRFWMPTTAPV